MKERLIRLVFLAHLASTLYMVGLIWIVQVVHYPLFEMLNRDDFALYEQRHTALITWVVGPPMLIEVVTAVLLFRSRPAGIKLAALWCGLGLLCVIWLSTALLQVPCHDGLSRGFDASLVQRLIWSNWIRTIGWTLRGLIILRMTSAALDNPVRGPEQEAFR